MAKLRDVVDSVQAKRFNIGDQVRCLHNLKSTWHRSPNNIDKYEIEQICSWGIKIKGFYQWFHHSRFQKIISDEPFAEIFLVEPGKPDPCHPTTKEQ